jgi:hypothetical protein
MDIWRVLASSSLALLFFGWTKVSAAPSDGGRILDTIAVHKVYVDGDFDQAIEMLKPALDGSYRLSHQDSVFIFKHLGVMYAAKYETREKGKKYMMLLLQTEPTARIMDMYASDMIYMIFKNLQDEYSLSLAKMKRAQGHLQGNAHGEMPVDSAKARSKNHAWAYWTGGALLAAGGIALTVYLAGDPEPIKHDHIIK